MPQPQDLIYLTKEKIEKVFGKLKPFIEYQLKCSSIEIIENKPISCNISHATIKGQNEEEINTFRLRSILKECGLIEGTWQKRDEKMMNYTMKRLIQYIVLYYKKEGWMVKQDHRYFHYILKFKPIKPINVDNIFLEELETPFRKKEITRSELLDLGE